METCDALNFTDLWCALFQSEQINSCVVLGYNTDFSEASNMNCLTEAWGKKNKNQDQFLCIFIVTSPKVKYAFQCQPTFNS